MAGDKRTQLIQGGRHLGLDLEAAVVDRLLVYLAELMKWNRRVNLMARDTTEAQALDSHFLDALSLLPLLRGSGAAVDLLDVGTGAGFPGLVLACVAPEIRVTLVEPRLKRVSFLRHLIRTLGLANTEVVADRIEPHLAAWQGRFSHVTSRAVAEPSIFLPLVRPLLGPKTEVLLMLARVEALAGLDDLDPPWHLVGTHPLTLPFSGAPRLLAVVRAG